MLAAPVPSPTKNGEISQAPIPCMTARPRKPAPTSMKPLKKMARYASDRSAAQPQNGREQSTDILCSDGRANLSGATAGIGHHQWNKYRREAGCERAKNGIGQVPRLDPMMHLPLGGDRLAFRRVDCLCLRGHNF